MFELRNYTNFWGLKKRIILDFMSGKLSKKLGQGHVYHCEAVQQLVSVEKLLLEFLKGKYPIFVRSRIPSVFLLDLRFTAFCF